MKTKLIYGCCLSMLISATTRSQVSYDQNSSTPPITGGNNTAFGQSALANNTTGFENVANGSWVLHLNTTGIGNSANGTHSMFWNDRGEYNSTNGHQSLFFNIGGSYNVASGANALYSNVSGYANVANGFEALYNNASGFDNIAHGYSSLYNNLIGSYNIAIGSNALYSNIVDNNIAIGYNALNLNTTGLQNTAIGTQALQNNVTGTDNTAGGFYSLRNNTGNSNTAYGSQSLERNTTGSSNAAFGNYACRDNLTGVANTGVGYHALHQNTAGNYNTACGNQALDNNKGSGNTAVGRNAMFLHVTGNDNTALGYNASISAGLSSAGAIGAFATSNASNRIWIGTATEHVWCQQAAWNTSDQRFKTSIKEDDVKGLDFIKLLRPVVYNFDTKKLTEHMTKNMPDSIRREHMARDFTKSTEERQSGFLAQEVAEAAKKSGYNFSGVHSPETDEDTYGLSYSLFVVPLVKAVQEQQVMIEEQKLKNEMLEKQLAEQKQMISELQQKTTTSTGLNQTGLVPNSFELGQNEPNPFSHETTIKYTLPQQVTNAYMAVYDLAGKQITTFPIDQKGTASIIITADKLAAGIYIYSIIADGKIVDSKRMIVAEK